MLRRFLVTLLVGVLACPVPPVAHAACGAAAVAADPGANEEVSGHEHCSKSLAATPAPSRPEADGCECCRKPGGSACDHGPALAGGCACLARGEKGEQPPATTVAAPEAPAPAVVLTLLSAAASTPRRLLHAPASLPAPAPGLRTSRPVLCSWTL